MSKEKINMNYRIKIIGGGLPKLKGSYKTPLFPVPAMEIFDILQEDSPKGEWLRKRKQWLDEKINGRCKNNKKVIFYTPRRNSIHQYRRYPSNWEDLVK